MMDIRFNHKMTASALEFLPDEVVVLDAGGKIVAVNAKWRRFAEGNGASESLRTGIGVDYLSVCREAARTGSPLALEALNGLNAILLRKQTVFTLEYPCHSPVDEHWFLMHAALFPPLGGLIITHIDITERKLHELAMWEAAHRDSLTGVLNRRGIAELSRTILSPESRQPPTTVAVADIAGLKTINDNLGHSVGDAVIRAAASALGFDGGPVARIGGDEFVAFFHVGNSRALVHYRRRIMAAFAEACGDLPATLSMGFALMHEDGETLDEVIAVADRRMYEHRRRRATEPGFRRGGHGFGRIA